MHGAVTVPVEIVCAAEAILKLLYTALGYEEKGVPLKEEIRDGQFQERGAPNQGSRWREAGYCGVRSSQLESVEPCFDNRG